MNIEDIQTENGATAYTKTRKRYDNPGGIRRLFRDYDATDINSNHLRIPFIADDISDPPEPIDEGTRIPRTGTSIEERTVDFDKYAFEVTDETTESSVLDYVTWMFGGIVNTAVVELYEELDVSWASRSDPLEIPGEAIARSSPHRSYNDIDTVVVPGLMADYIERADPSRSWGEITRDYRNQYDVLVLRDDDNLLRASDVVVADTDMMGFEFHRTEPTANSYVEYENWEGPHVSEKPPEDELVVDQHVTQVYLRMGYAVLEPDAGQIVRFGDL